MSLLARLEEHKGEFGAAAARTVAELLERAKRARFPDPEEIVRLHEAVLYLRAYPQSPRVLRLADEILFSFHHRIPRAARSEFEYSEISGIAGTGLTTNFSYPFAKSLAARHGDRIRIDWDQYQHPERLAWTLAKLIPEAREDWAIAPHPDWRRWYESAGGSLQWLMAGVSPETYDLLELPLRWELYDSAASRSRARIERPQIFYHDRPFLRRADVSIEAEFSAPRIAAKRLPRRRAQQILEFIIDASAVRYRELYGFLYPDTANVFHADLGRGVDFFFFGVPRKWRLPKRAYYCGMYCKNGVPIGYVEVMSLAGRMEVGFNLYYTFRQGETAWLYVCLMKLFRERFRVTSFFIDPYQLGHENDEAIESGAFWFYYKLGFRPESRSVARLAGREAEKIAARPGYRTSKAMLRKLAAGPVVYNCG